MLDFARTAPRPKRRLPQLPVWTSPRDTLRLVFHAPFRSCGTLWIVIMLGVPAVADAAPVMSVVEYGYAGSAKGASTHAVAGLAAMPVGSGSAFAMVSRFDDALLGDGIGYGGGGAFPIASRALIQASATRSVARTGQESWRLRVGPQYVFDNGGAAGIAYAHEDGPFTGPADGVVADYSVPILPSVSARTSLSYTTAGPLSSAGGTLGMSWRVLPRIELTADAGVAKHALGVAGFGSSGADFGGRRSEVTNPVFLGFRVLTP